MVINLTPLQIVDAMNAALVAASIDYSFALNVISSENWAQLFSSESVLVAQKQIEDETSVRELKTWLLDTLMKQIANSFILALDVSFEAEFAGF